MKLPARVALAVLLGALLPRGAAAQTPEQFYKGRTVTLIVGFAPGGINDISARIVGKHLGRFIPGNPTVVVQNMPGAGGLRGANYLYNLAPRDGLVMGVVSQTVAVGQVLATTPGIQYDARSFTWIGRINSNVEKVPLLAARWSLDPAAIDERFLQYERGVAGERSRRH